MKIKTSELSGAALKFAVAIAEGWQDWDKEDFAFSWHKETGPAWLTLDTFKPFELWEQGGPIIEREGISIRRIGQSVADFMALHPDCWCAGINDAHEVYAKPPLLAAMRCFVASKLGDTVDVPDELKGAE